MFRERKLALIMEKSVRTAHICLFSLSAIFTSQAVATLPAPPNSASPALEYNQSLVLTGQITEKVAPADPNRLHQHEKWVRAQIKKVESDPRYKPEDAEQILKQLRESIDSAKQGRTILTKFQLVVTPDGFLWDYTNSDTPENRRVGLMSKEGYSDFALVPDSGEFAVERDNFLPQEKWYTAPWFFAPAYVATFYNDAEWKPDGGKLTLTLSKPDDKDRGRQTFPHGMRVVYTYSADASRLHEIRIDDGSNKSDGLLITPVPETEYIHDIVPKSFRVFNVVKGKPEKSELSSLIEISSEEVSQNKSIKDFSPWKPGDRIRDNRFGDTVVYPYDPSQTQEDIAERAKMQIKQTISKNPSGIRELLGKVSPIYFGYAMGAFLLGFGLVLKVRNR